MFKRIRTRRRTLFGDKYEGPNIIGHLCRRFRLNPKIVPPGSPTSTEVESLRSELDSKNTDFLDCLEETFEEMTEFMKSKHNLHKQPKAMIKKAKRIFRVYLKTNSHST
ncbi:unnamed protein product [Trichogramma brassicae]|uniref:Uncharacterized protein n=1 Tax=Trichogramma brassicae TaxID=86971 RepID=A0A6H5IV72_9HYME|nr:unnamed protein product [Trichogramma brassicae]